MTTTKKKKTSSKGAKLRVSQGHEAKVAIRNIEALFEKMELDPKRVKRDRHTLLGTAHVPAKLIEEVAAVADQHGTLVGMPFDSDAAREALAFAAAFEPVATKAEAFAQRVRDAILVAKSDAGAKALAVYAAMKGVVRTEAGAPLRDSFDKMTTIMKQRRKRAPKAEAQAQAQGPAQTETPATQPAATKPAATPAATAKTSPGNTTIVVTPAEPTS